MKGLLRISLRSIYVPQKILVYKIFDFFSRATAMLNFGLNLELLCGIKNLCPMHGYSSHLKLLPLL